MIDLNEEQRDPMMDLEKEAPTKEDLTHEDIKPIQPDVELEMKYSLSNSLELITEKFSDDLPPTQDF